MMQKSVKTPLSWDPVAHGKVYCAPACGAGCTKAAFNAATRAGKALAKRLGKGWKATVWENMGWHYAAISECGRWKVHPSLHRGKVVGYMAFLGSPGHGGRWVEHGKTPQSAIKNTRKVARLEANGIQALLDMAVNA